MPNAPRHLDDIREEYEFLDGDERYRLLIELGRELDEMPDALKTDATLVRGCSAAVWVYPQRSEDGRLHFLADSNAAITKGASKSNLSSPLLQPGLLRVRVAISPSRETSTVLIGGFLVAES